MTTPLHGIMLAWTSDVVNGDLPPTISIQSDWIVPGAEVTLPKINVVELINTTLDPMISLIPATIILPETPKATGGRG